MRAILFSKFSAGKWNGVVDTIALVGTAVTFAAFTFVIVRWDF